MNNMNLIINEISSDYNDDEFRINEIFLTYVMEAEDVTSVDDSSNKMKFGEMLSKQAHELIQILFGIIQRAFLKISNFLSRVSQSNNGFINDCRKAIVKNKPLEGVKLITYQYNDGILDGEMNKMTNIILKKIADTKTSYAEISSDDNNDSGDIIGDLFKELRVPSDIKNINTYFMYIKDKFRTSKKENLFTANKTQQYYSNATNIKKIINISNNRKQIINQQTNTIKSNLQNIIKNNMSQNEIKQKALRKYKNMTHLYNFYVHFIEIYVQLKVEESLTYRMVLKKLYHF